MALDILHDNWGPYTHTEVENALKAYLSGLDDRINKAIQSGGVGLTDLSAEVQALLNKADTALQSETDPTVPNWAKQSNKPTYNVSEIIFSSNRSLSSKLDEMTAEILAAGATDSEMSDSSKKPVQNKVIKAYVDAAVLTLQNALNALMNGQSVTDAIDTFNEVKAFLNGIDTDDPTLSNQLLALNNAITALQTALAGKISGIRANGASSTLPVDQNGVVELPPSSSGENNVQSNWAETDTTNAAYIKNKPDLTQFATKTELNSKQNTISDLASIRINSGKGMAGMSSNEDGTVVFALANGDYYTLDLNHEHPQYIDINDIDDYITAGTNVTITKDPQTGTIEISASGGNNGITAITMNGYNVAVSNGVANLGTVITSHQDISGKADKSEMAVSTSGDQTIITLKTGMSATVINQHQSLNGYAKYVLISEADYEALTTKDSSTLYLIPES